MFDNSNKIWEFLAYSLIIGIIITLLTGLIPNQPEITLPESRFYGYPLYWLIRAPLIQKTDIIMSYFLIDLVFFWGISLLALGIYKSQKNKTEKTLQ